ncbi:hypothetical protein NEOLEDRAFT_236544 [Neolentinus lepideus HHB14362 ss-1]|uniref:Uncharacterized protein n=1 Tax=Neolentinus lepideus HHB14362 ss-1 TaxID=1314782 RepID=A0A165TGH5_9AGAM|nr:hypothetical protein NEOLEDRAFT_236544 [Neolentinus lepideus HHB14362 ss-1]
MRINGHHYWSATSIPLALAFSASSVRYSARSADPLGVTAPLPPPPPSLLPLKPTHDADAATARIGAPRARRARARARRGARARARGCVARRSRGGSGSTPRSCGTSVGPRSPPPLPFHSLVLAVSGAPAGRGSARAAAAGGSEAGG